MVETQRLNTQCTGYDQLLGPIDTDIEGNFKYSLINLAYIHYLQVILDIKLCQDLLILLKRVNISLWF